MKQLKEIYIVHVDGLPAAFGCVQGNPHHFYSFCPKDKFVDWIQGIKEDFPDYNIRCVKNDGIVEWLKERKQTLQNINKNCIEL